MKILSITLASKSPKQADLLDAVEWAKLEFIDCTKVVRTFRTREFSVSIDWIRL